MNVKLPLMPINCLFIYFCYNIYHVIVPNWTREKGKRKSKEEETEQKYKENPDNQLLHL